MNKLKPDQEDIVGELLAISVIGINLQSMLDIVELLPEDIHGEMIQNIEILFISFNKSSLKTRRLIDNE
jgi:hypothetical protein